MNALTYSGQYLKYGLACVFNINQSKFDSKYTNDGDCNYSWATILGYTLSLFTIQLTLNSIMSHKFGRYAQMA